MNVIPLAIMTAVLVLGVVGTVGKLLFDDWQLRRALRSSKLQNK